MFWLFSVFLAIQAQVLLNSLHKVETSYIGSKKLAGKIPIDTDDYQAVCECNENYEEKAIVCNPTKIKLSEDRTGLGVSYKEISDFLSDHKFEYIKAKTDSFRCLDGRDKEKGLSTPGGDTGEFILALLVYEDASGTILDYQTVKNYLEEWLKSMQSHSFYMCTDDEAVLHLGKQIGADMNIQNPRKDLIKELLNIVFLPRNVGDSHLRLMLEYPQLYSIRPEVVKYVITAVYAILWTKDTDLHTLVNLDILVGNHEEIAILR